VNIKLNMFGPPVLYWIVRKINGADIATKNNGSTADRSTKLSKKLSNPTGLDHGCSKHICYACHQSRVYKSDTGRSMVNKGHCGILEVLVTLPSHNGRQPPSSIYASAPVEEPPTILGEGGETCKSERRKRAVRKIHGA
jgi:hypothetical protein